jgi:hypothetical protein
MTFKALVRKSGCLLKKFVTYSVQHYLGRAIVCFVILFFGLQILLIGNVPFTEDQRPFYFVGNDRVLKSDLDFDGRQETFRIDRFNFWGGNGGQMIAILESDQSEILGCWDLGEYRSYINSLKASHNIISIDMMTHQKGDPMSLPSKRVVYQFSYDYYNRVLTFDNDFEFEFGENGIRSKPEPCDWNFRAYLTKKGFELLDFKSYFRFLNLLFSMWRENQYYGYYRVQASNEN